MVAWNDTFDWSTDLMSLDFLKMFYEAMIERLAANGAGPTYDFNLATYVPPTLPVGFYPGQANNPLLRELPYIVNYVNDLTVIWAGTYAYQTAQNPFSANASGGPPYGPFFPLTALCQGIAYERPGFADGTISDLGNFNFQGLTLYYFYWGAAQSLSNLPSSNISDVLKTELLGNLDGYIFPPLESTMGASASSLNVFYPYTDFYASARYTIPMMTSDLGWANVQPRRQRCREIASLTATADVYGNVATVGQAAYWVEVLDNYNVSPSLPGGGYSYLLNPDFPPLFGNGFYVAPCKPDGFYTKRISPYTYVYNGSEWIPNGSHNADIIQSDHAQMPAGPISFRDIYGPWIFNDIRDLFNKQTVFVCSSPNSLAYGSFNPYVIPQPITGVTVNNYGNAYRYVGGTYVGYGTTSIEAQSNSLGVVTAAIYPTPTSSPIYNFEIKISVSRPYIEGVEQYASVVSWCGGPCQITFAPACYTSREVVLYAVPKVLDVVEFIDGSVLFFDGGKGFQNGVVKKVGSLGSGFEYPVTSTQTLFDGVISPDPAIDGVTSFTSGMTVAYLATVDYSGGFEYHS